MKTDTQSKKKPLTPEQLLECETLNSIFLSKKNELGLSQAKIADMAGITPPAISHYLKGKNPLNVTIAVVFSKALKVAIGAFSPRLAGEAAKISYATNTRVESIDRVLAIAHERGVFRDQDICDALKVPIAKLQHWKANGIPFKDVFYISEALNVEVQDICPFDPGDRFEFDDRVEYTHTSELADDDYAQHDEDFGPRSVAGYLYPLLDESQARSPFASIGGGLSAETQDIASVKWAGPHGFWVRVTGDSMATMDGLGLNDGALVLINPDISPSAGSLGLFFKPNQTPSMCARKLIEDGGQRYLRPINRDYKMSALSDGWESIGVIIDARHPDSFFAGSEK